MAVSLASKLKIPSKKLDSLGVFNPILDLDTRLFVDPHLLKHTDVPELSQSYTNFQQHFLKINKLLTNSDSEKSIFWRRADKLMTWPEVKGLCIGYSSTGTSGSGIGPELRKRLLHTAKLIIDKGRDDPELFELVGLFEDDFGPDRISDMTANIIKEDLRNYTRRILSELKVDLKKYFSINNKSGLPINPFNGEDITLIPKSILRDLPLALDWSSRDIIAIHNDDLRESVNKTIGETWKQAARSGKATLKDVLLSYPELLDDLIEKYTSKDAQPYDYEADKSGRYLWYKLTEEIVYEHPLALSLSAHPTIDEVEKIVIAICDKFIDLIENNGWWKLLYNDDGSTKHEEASQLLFYGISERYCEANNIMISRESDSGRGPVDFKFGTNMSNSVLVEIKKSTNTSGLLKGIKKQLPAYMKSEKSKRAIYLVIDVGFTEAAIDNLNEANALINGSAIKIMQADGNPKASASK